MGISKLLTKLIYNKIYQLIPKLISNKEIELSNFLQDNYTKLEFENDKIVLKLSNRTNVSIVNKPIENYIIKDIIFTIDIKLSKYELSQKKLVNNKVRTSINKEVLNLIGNDSKPIKTHQTHQDYSTIIKYDRDIDYSEYIEKGDI